MKKKYKSWYLSEDTIEKVKEIVKKEQYISQSAYITKLINEKYEKQKNTN